MLKRFTPQSIRSRLALYFTLAFGTTLILTSALCYQIFVSTHQANFDASLYNHAIDVASAIDPNSYGGIEFHPFSKLDFEKRVPFSVGRSYMELRDPGGRFLGSSSNLSEREQLPFSDEIRNTILANGVDYRTVTGISPAENKEIDYRLISYLINKPGMFPVILQIAVPLTIIQENQRAFFLLLLFLIPSGILISTMLALWASRRAFSPVLLMAKQTEQIEVKNLKDRVQVIENDTELKELGRTLNLLLARIEASVNAQDRFVADASHQLKTPLAIIQGELELLLSATKTSAHAENKSQDLPEAIQSIQQEVSALIRLVENLLLLARMDAGYGPLPFHTVRLDEIISESARRHQRLAEKSGLKLLIELRPDLSHTDSQIDFEIPGDAFLLRCLVDNLIDNGIKYSRKNLNPTSPAAEIAISLSESSQAFVLEVKDPGLGLDAGELAQLFQRFQRDPKKSLETSGSGLGLVIVKRIAELHHGDVSFTSSKGQGTTARVQLRKS